ncbi:cytochrome P450 [Radiomyces spectabilis]|uniref:cytochrome P450 n=1 Tax=Radiomyces spectabilis TaxID=64574 RepID=UPI0022200956|nr:cytochrome P450 [Radiomyces spectabilis]KAI8379559.1 cytochrome P450 [Radiomyces spectabilis]
MSPKSLRYFQSTVGSHWRVILNTATVLPYNRLATILLTAPLLRWLYRCFVYRLSLHPANRLPGPPTEWIPFSGNLKEIATNTLLTCLLSWSKQYGDIFRYRILGYEPHIVITDPKLVKQILGKKHDIFVKASDARTELARRLGYGLIVAEGDVHRQQRKMLNPAFSVQAMRQIFPLMAQSILELRNKWLGKVGSDKTMTIDALEAFHSMTLDVIARAGFGQDFQCVDDKRGDRFVQAYEALHVLEPPWLVQVCFLYPWFHHVPMKNTKKIKHTLTTIQEETMAMVEEALQRKNAGDQLDGVLGEMTKEINHDTGHGLSAKELQAQCLNFLHAGHETMTSALSWALWLLAKHPDIQHDVRKEIRQAFEVTQTSTIEASAGESMEVPSYDIIIQLPILNNICKETLRLYPPVPVSIRTPTEDTLVGEHLIPKDTFVLLAPMITHRQQEWWGDDADIFRPSRWNEAPANAIDPYVYMPFLAGPHLCIGNRFAWAEMKIALAILLKDLHFSEVPGSDPGMKHQIVLFPKRMQLLMQKL